MQKRGKSRQKEFPREMTSTIPTHLLSELGSDRMLQRMMLQVLLETAILHPAFTQLITDQLAPGMHTLPKCAMPLLVSSNKITALSQKSI